MLIKITVLWLNRQGFLDTYESRCTDERRDSELVHGRTQQFRAGKGVSARFGYDI